MQVPNSLSSPLQAASPPTPFVVGGGGGGPMEVEPRQARCVLLSDAWVSSVFSQSRLVNHEQSLTWLRMYANAQPVFKIQNWTVGPEISLT